MHDLGDKAPRHLSALQRFTDAVNHIPFLRQIHMATCTFDNVRARPGPGGGEWMWPGHRGDPAQAFDGPVETRRVILYIHGGAFVLCNPATHRAVVAGLTAMTDAHVFSCDYRRAPEHQFPSALTDVVAAYRSVLKLCPAERVMVAGESAGGNLTLALCLRLAEEGLPPPSGLILISPWVDLTDLQGPNWETTKDFVPGDLASDFATSYASGVMRPTGLVSPALASKEQLRVVPPTLLIYGGGEYLAGQCAVLSNKLQAAGVFVDEFVGEGMVHGFPIFADCAYGRIGHMFVLGQTVLILLLLSIFTLLTFAHAYTISWVMFTVGAVLAMFRYRRSQRSAERTYGVGESFLSDASVHPAPMEAFARMKRFADKRWKPEPTQMMMN